MQKPPANDQHSGREPHPDTRRGLSSAEARKRLKEHGPNTARREKEAPWILQFLSLFANPLLLLLLASALVSTFFGEIRSAVVIVVMVLMSAGLDVYNTFRSSKAAEKLRATIALTAAVIRDGKEREIPVEDIVPGDSVILRVGDIVPADGVIGDPRHLFINESALTGESFPVAKEPGNEAWMGSSVVTGEATLRVTATGARTRFNSIVAHLHRPAEPTEFDREISAFSMLILRVTVVLAVFVFAANALLKGTVLDALLFAMALAVGMTPELMPMIITLNLTRGSLAMARRGVIVKRLSSIQNFGSMDLLCTDKTGTLTEDRIVLIKHVDAYGKESEDVMQYAFLTSTFGDGFKNPLDEAIRRHPHLVPGKVTKLDEIPFDFTRRRSSVVLEHAGRAVLICKGAPESVFAACTEIHHTSLLASLGASHGQPHTSIHRQIEPREAAGGVGHNGRHDPKDVLAAARATYEAFSREGFRVLALATRTMEKKRRFDVRDEVGLSFLGLLAFLDPPKATASSTLKRMRELGIGVKIITGDNDLVSRHVAGAIGLTITGVMLGEQIDALSDEELNGAAHGVNLFARVSPDQKLRIIRTLRAHGHTVGYIGDGVNDAPSLKQADVGISVSNATDIARESADLIMVRRELDDLTQAVVEGRKTFANTAKYLMMTLSSNFGNMFSMAGASVLLPFLPMLPAQVLLNNFLYDCSQFTLSGDAVDAGDLRTPKKMNLRLVKKFMLVMGPVSSLFDFLTFGLLWFLLRLPQPQFQAGWFAESLATQVFVVYVIRTKLLPFLQSRPSRSLVIGTVAVVVAGWCIALLSLGTFVGFQPPPLSALLAIAAMVAVYLVAMEVVKRWFYARLATAEEKEEM